MNAQPDFGFADETGVAKDPNQPYFGVGLLVVHGDHLQLNRELRRVFLEAVRVLRSVEERFEFKFSYITPNSLPFYEDLLDILSKTSESWTFHVKFQKHKQRSSWLQYVRLLKSILEPLPEKLIVLADYLDQPKNTKATLSKVAGEINSVIGITQVESQGIVLLQAADILLGALAFEKRKGKDKYKSQVVQRVVKLFKQKNEERL